MDDIPGLCYCEFLEAIIHNRLVSPVKFEGGKLFRMALPAEYWNSDTPWVEVV